MTDGQVSFVHEIAKRFQISHETVLHKYVERKTKASDRDSKARRSLGNLYALYVLCEDHLNGDQQGSTFTDLMRRMKALPFGAKLQNHPLDNRLNDEVRRQYSVVDSMLPVQRADLDDGTKARKISQELLSEGGMNPTNAAKFVVSAIDKYVEIIDDNQTAYLNEIEAADSADEIVKVIEKAFLQQSDARLFEIVSYGLLRLHFAETTVTISQGDTANTEPLALYRTGRTNANDGGIDFVLKPLGKFFQVTETLDFKKYFLDFEKINRYPMSFVIKTDLAENEVRQQIQDNASKEYPEDTVSKYMQLFDDIYTLNELGDILRWIKDSAQRITQLKTIVVECFKLEYGISE